MKSTLQISTHMLAALALLFAATALADEFSLDWYSIDGGGDMWTAAGGFELSGTIGQPDAGVVMTGGEYELTGGFWAIGGAPAVCVGDLNCDGTINFGDINPFVSHLSNYPQWQQIFPGCPGQNGDINGDGTYGTGSFADINPFVALMVQSPLQCE